MLLSLLHGPFEIGAVSVAWRSTKLEEAFHAYDPLQIVPVIFGFYNVLGPPVLDFFFALAVEPTVTDKPVPVIVVVVWHRRWIASKGLFHDGSRNVSGQVVEFRGST